MEFVTSITSVIGSIGFPCVMCLLLYKQMKDMGEQNKEEINTLSNAINNNTQVMQRILDKLNMDE